MIVFKWFVVLWGREQEILITRQHFFGIYACIIRSVFLFRSRFVDIYARYNKKMVYVSAFFETNKEINFKKSNITEWHAALWLLYVHWWFHLLWGETFKRLSGIFRTQFLISNFLCFPINKWMLNVCQLSIGCINQLYLKLCQYLFV